jgi:hypothetical protein
MPHSIRKAAAIAIIVGATALTTMDTASPAQADSQVRGLAATVRADAAGQIAAGAPSATASPDGTAAVTTSAGLRRWRRAVTGCTLSAPGSSRDTGARSSPGGRAQCM